MKRIFLVLALTLCACSALWAQQNQQAMTEEEREKWLSEYRNYKHEVITKELRLTREQQNEFFPIYDLMDEQLMQIGNETRNLQAKVNNDPNAGDIEYEAAARAIYEQKSREGAVELEYFDKFKEVLTPKQLICLKNAERKFTQTLAKQRFKNAGPKHKQ